MGSLDLNYMILFLTARVEVVSGLVLMRHVQEYVRFSGMGNTTLLTPNGTNSMATVSTL